MYGVYHAPTGVPWIASVWEAECGKYKHVAVPVLRSLKFKYWSLGDYIWYNILYKEHKFAHTDGC